MLSQRNFKPDNPSSLFPVRRLLHSTHPKWTPDRIGYAGLLSSLKIQVPRCVEVDYFESSFPRHLTLATCLETKIRPPPPPKGRKARVNCKCQYEQKRRNEVRWRQRLDVSDSGRNSFPLLTQEDKRRLCLQCGMERDSCLSRTRQGNPESCAWESTLQLNESGIPLKFGARNPIFTDKEPRVQNPWLSWILLHGMTYLFKIWH